MASREWQSGLSEAKAAQPLALNKVVNIYHRLQHDYQ